MMLIQYDEESGEIIGKVFGADAETFEQPVLEVEDNTHIDKKQVDTASGSLVWEDSLQEAKSRRISQIKEQAREILEKTDWYVVRENETGESIPQNILDHRSTVRSQSETFEQEVANLGSVGEVLNYEYQFPSPPKLDGQ